MTRRMTVRRARPALTGHHLRLVAGVVAGVVAGGMAGGMAMGGGTAAAQPAARSADADESAVKAAFVYNFAKFATWPATAFAGPQAPLVLCMVGDIPFKAALVALDGKPVGERRLVARAESPDRAGDCHLLVVGAPPVHRFADLAAALKGRPVLTVGDADGFARRGGAIGLVLEDSRIRFEVNPRALDGTGVTLSSQLLRLARIVESAP